MGVDTEKMRRNSTQGPGAPAGIAGAVMLAACRPGQLWPTDQAFHRFSVSKLDAGISAIK